ncbi:hypothetical protein [Marinifilum caeruleilacunae]|uniref:Uncharacterized protein n=1 Tax=Marinifilum caeruleilacunae TaxID=2499076 RepID=A0ABX1WT71_9BACT|nr:hypothetical protein [Marinifilum caeruleilacunae]NOU59295.1 hypothetical protein [Marinifilum caeruleilacunae]
MKKREIAILNKLLAVKGKRTRAKTGLLQIKRVAIAIVLVAFMLPVNQHALANDKKIKPGKKQATLILSDGRKIVLGTKSDTIVNSQTNGVRIVVDSTGINYITTDSIKKVIELKKKEIESKKKKESNKK